MSKKRKIGRTCELSPELQRLIKAMQKAAGQAGDGGLLVDTGPSEPGTPKDLDARFFEANPTRSLRMRRIAYGELSFEPSGIFLYGPTHILVRQIAPGCRLKWRVPPQVSRGELDAVPDSEPILEALWGIATGEQGALTLHDILYSKECVGGVH